MFSGIIKCTGIIESVIEKGTTRLLTVSSPVSNSLTIDQSVAHDGVCLTVVQAGNGSHQVEVVRETLEKTTFQSVKPGHVINLEKSITPATLLDGHLVQGHVDTTVACRHIEDLDGSWEMKFELPVSFASLLIPHGSICLNGISLTVAGLDPSTFSVAIIPYTYKNTNLQYLKPGDQVNVEFDLIGKYIIRQLELRSLVE